MADSDKKVKRRFSPAGNVPRSVQSPDTFNAAHPSWRFSLCDKACWGITADDFINDILPKLKEWETQTWNEILVVSKKQNHSIDVEKLNKIAQNRLEELRIEAQSIVSLRLQGTHRLYGYRSESIFYILWYDKNHGDNETCVCRSRKK